MSRPDPHSYFDASQPRTHHFDWEVKVDFAARRLEGAVTLHLEGAQAGPLDLDTRDLEIASVTAGPGGAALPFQLAPAEPILGARLRVELPAGCQAVHVAYRTSPSASALQWLEPAQTKGGKHPFLYTQCQAIHARSVLPIQDSPAVRVRYTARVEAPAGLTALMAAEQLGGGRFRMEEPIPPYLVALAVGELESRELGTRSRVWAEPAQVEAARHEFEGVDAILSAAEKLLGPYDWGRFDLLVLPPAFPYGGMENPRLTFLTPTLLAGDRSLVNVVAHELAHSWTGNLVTNASAEDFWLNEGFTVFAERRILEAVEGPELAALHAALGRRSLDEAVAQFAERPALTRLRTHLSGIDPDDAYSVVPYEKGYLFLRALEDQAGRERFTVFLRAYAQRFRFGSLTTQQFLDFVRAELPGALEAVGWAAWVDGEGVPANAPAPRSARLEAVEAVGQTAPTEAQARAWVPAEWQLYLKRLATPVDAALLAELDRRFGLTQSGNAEVLAAWLEVGVRSGYAPAVARTETFLGQVGRGKYLRPLYAALASRPETKPLALSCFSRYRAGYHAIASGVLASRLGLASAPA